MRKSLIVSLAIVAALIVAGVVYGPRLQILVTVGAGYTAKQVCSCLYVAGRSAESCAREPESPADTLVKWTADGHKVHASTLGLAHATARYDEGFGCVLED
jgi:hypothetical protein